VPWGTLKKISYPIDLGGIMNARLIGKATTLDLRRRKLNAYDLAVIA
jgi:hypothetical protein